MPEVRNISFLVDLMFVYVGISDFAFFDFLDLNKFLTISSASLPLLTLTTLLSSSSNTFEAKFDNPVIFNIEVSNATIFLKPWMKRQ